ncbi:MAG TPA: DJ-1/PfpI family protein [Polyangia bacterium]|nr:DJ-1/PfpI family protein [Polyangia bacterium]
MTQQAWAALVGLFVAIGLLPSGQGKAAPRAPRTRNVAVVVFEGVELLDFAGPLQVFAAAAQFGEMRGQPAFHVYTMARTKSPVKSHGVLQVVPEYSIDDAPPPDIIVLPGGDTSSLQEDPRFMQWVKDNAARAEVSMSVCTGAFVLGRAGLLDGHTATTWYNAVEGLRKAMPRANVQEGRRFVDEGRVVTTAGVSAGIDGALHIVARLLGRAIADETARYLEYRWTPEPYLAKHYSLLTPGLDGRGRALQMARLLEREQSWPEAIKAWRALTQENAKDGYAWHRLAFALYHTGDLAGAIAAAQRAAALPDVRADALVNLACYYVHAGRRADALTALEQAVDAGLKGRWRLQGDEDLAPLHGEPRFQKLLARLG